MSDVQDITYNGSDAGGQTLYLDVPEGRPSSVTSIKVLSYNESDDLTGKSATAGSPAVETNPNTTVDAASGNAQSDPRLINLTATTGITAHRQYLLTDAKGRNEWCEVTGITSGASVTVRAPLALDYVATDTFVSTRISDALDDTWCASEANVSDSTRTNPAYRVRWIYVVSSVTYVRYSYFRFTRMGGAHNVRPMDVDVLFPGFLANLPPDHRKDEGQALIDEAYRQLRVDLHAVDIPAELARNQDIVDELVRHRTVLLWAEAVAMTGGSPEPLEIARARWDARWASLIRGPSQPRIPIATDSSSIGRAVEAVSLTRR